MQYEYRDLVRDCYVGTGDWESSKKAAEVLLRQKWGVSEINGEREIVPYAIEDFYCNDAFSVEKLKLRTFEYLNRKYKAHGRKPVPNLDGIRIYPDTRTVREIQNGGFPTYRVYSQNEYGQYDDTLYGEEVRLSLSDVWDKYDRAASGIFDTATQINQVNALRYMMKRNNNIRYMQKTNELYRISEKTAKGTVDKENDGRSEQ